MVVFEGNGPTPDQTPAWFFHLSAMAKKFTYLFLKSLNGADGALLALYKDDAKSAVIEALADPGMPVVRLLCSSGMCTREGFVAVCVCMRAVARRPFETQL